MKCKFVLSAFLFLMSLTFAWAQKVQKADSIYKNIKNYNLETVRFRIDEQYKKAFKLYEEARIDSSLTLLNEITKHSISFGLSSRDLKADVYRLSALSYLLIDSLSDARRCIKKMLAFKPFYLEENVVQDDLDRFIDALDTLIASPQLSFGIKAGVNYSNLKIDDNFSILEFDNLGVNNFSINPALAVSVGMTSSYTLSRFVSLAFDPEFFQSKSILKSTNPIADLSISQAINYVNLPLSLRVNLFFNRRKIMPYLELGAFTTLMISARQTISNEEIPIDLFLRDYNYGLHFGVGYMQFVKNFGIGTSIRYSRNLNWSNEPSTRYLSTQSSNNLIYRYFQVLQDINLSSLTVQFILVYHLRYKVY